MIGTVRLIRLGSLSQTCCSKKSRSFHAGPKNSFLFTGTQTDDVDERSQFHSEKRLLGYSPEQMFEVVSRVEDYNQFVPWCKKSKVNFRDEEHLLASLVVGFPPLFGEAYNSHVVLFKPHLVTAVCTDMTMFHHLKTVWKFETIPGHPNACNLDFAVSFAFKSSMHSYLAKRFFDDVIKQNVQAFLNQARKKYGPPIPTTNIPRRQ